MIDNLLGIASTFDWISPVAGVVGDLMNGPSHTFLIPWAGCSLSGREIGQALNKGGVRYWGMMIVSDTLMVSVRLGQARHAQQILERVGVTIENPPPQTPQRKRQKRARRSGGVFSVFDIFDERR